MFTLHGRSPMLPVQGQLGLVAGGFSRINPCAPDPLADAALANRVARGSTAEWAQAPLTHCPHHGALPLSSLRQVLQQRLQGVPSSFRAFVRLTR